MGWSCRRNTSADGDVNGWMDEVAQEWQMGKARELDRGVSSAHG